MAKRLGGGGEGFHLQKEEFEYELMFDTTWISKNTLGRFFLGTEVSPVYWWNTEWQSPIPRIKCTEVDGD